MNNYKMRRTCARQLNFTVENNIITSLEFVGGCAGNTRGVAALAVGRDIDEVIALTRGIPCRGGTSCPDQLSRALEEYKINSK